MVCGGILSKKKGAARRLGWTPSFSICQIKLLKEFANTVG